MAPVLTGAVKSSWSVLCRRSSAQIFIVRIGTISSATAQPVRAVNSWGQEKVAGSAFSMGAFIMPRIPDGQIDIPAGHIGRIGNRNAVAFVGDNETMPSSFGFGEKSVGNFVAYNKD